MPVEIYTAQMRYSGDDRLDITVKTGDKVFAPTWDMVMSHKSYSLSDDEYKKKYIDLMRKSRRDNSSRWQEIMNKERVVLVCYCGAGKFCHRILLAKMLEMIGAIYKGELQPEQYPKRSRKNEQTTNL